MIAQLRSVLSSLRNGLETKSKSAPLRVALTFRLRSLLSCIDLDDF